jgi:hypothetical protein
VEAAGHNAADKIINYQAADKIKASHADLLKTLIRR